MRSHEEAFHKHVQRTGGCWFWSGPRTDRGYGRFYFNNRGYRAHRVAYELAYGSVPEGFEVCHRCDCRHCVRPDHLFLGSHADNMGDMSLKDRGARLRGELDGNAKLTWDQVRSLRAEYKAGRVSQRALARRYGISQGAVWQIVTNRQWVE